MKRFLSGLSVVMLILLLSNSAWADEFIRVKGLVWYGILDGEIKSSTTLINGTKVDLRRDLHTELSSDIPALEFKTNLLGGLKFSASYWQAAYEGKKTLVRNVAYGGKNFSIGDRVKTDMGITGGNILYEHSFIPKSFTKAFPSLLEAEFNVLVGLEYLGLKSKISSATTGISNKESAAVTIPVVGLFTQVGLLKKKLTLELGAIGMAGRIGDYDFAFTDAYAELRIKVTPFVPVGIGYKIVDLEVDKEGDDKFAFDLSIDGLYFFTSVSF